MDGVDAAIIKTDGAKVARTGQWLTLPYDTTFRAGLKSVLGKEEKSAEIKTIEKNLTLYHVKAVEALLKQAKLSSEDINLIGFHGHTLAHKPKQGITWQIGDAKLLAKEVGIDVISNFRSADVEAGGQGAPLVPLYHAALFHSHQKPMVVVNIGGVANVTYLGKNAKDILAFDTGPGNAMIDDYLFSKTGGYYDEGGKLALKGAPNQPVVESLLSHPYFKQTPPKSLDRKDFDAASLKQRLESLSLEDIMATLAEFTARTIAMSLQHFPKKWGGEPKEWYVTGGGRYNRYIMQRLQVLLKSKVEAIEGAGLEGDALEAEAFAYLAVRSKLGLPLSLPTTTGVKLAVTGGVFYPA